MREYLTMTGEAKEQQETRRSMLDRLVQQGAALIVEKDRIAANGEYNLSAERYRDTNTGSSRFPDGAIG